MISAGVAGCGMHACVRHSKAEMNLCAPHCILTWLHTVTAEAQKRPLSHMYPLTQSRLLLLCIHILFICACGQGWCMVQHTCCAKLWSAKKFVHHGLSSVCVAPQVEAGAAKDELKRLRKEMLRLKNEWTTLKALYETAKVFILQAYDTLHGCVLTHQVLPSFRRWYWIAALRQ